MHGTVNVLQPAPEARPLRAVGLEAGPSDYWRREARRPIRLGRPAYGLAAHVTHDGGWRDDAGFDEAKFNATAAGAGATSPRGSTSRPPRSTRTRRASSPARTPTATSRRAAPMRTPRPSARRSALRLIGLFERPGAVGARLELRPYLRSSRMEFLQHFLLGKPLERNGQDSLGLMARWCGTSARPPARGGARPRAGGLLPVAGTGRPHHRRRAAGQRDPSRRQALRLLRALPRRRAVRARRATRRRAADRHRRVARRGSGLRLRQPHAGRQHGRERRALPARGLPLQPPRRPHRRLRQPGAEAASFGRVERARRGLRSRVDGLPSTGDHRALPAAAQPGERRSRLRAPRRARGGHQGVTAVARPGPGALRRCASAT